MQRAFIGNNVLSSDHILKFILGVQIAIFTFLSEQVLFLFNSLNLNIVLIFFKIQKIFPKVKILIFMKSINIFSVLN